MSTLGQPARDHVSLAPTSRLGRWAVGLALAAVGLVAAAALVPRGAALGFAAAVAAGVAGMVAVVRERERAVSVFLALVPLAVAVAFVAAELIGGWR